MDRYGLLGRNISYSFSRGYFSRKFEQEKIAAIYENFDLESISQFPTVLQQYPDLKGLNVTIPYKEQVIEFLDKLDLEASEIGAVNTIQVQASGELKGYNTDHYGFSESIKPFLNSHHEKALILGTGGASKAILFACNKLGIEPRLVSRDPGPTAFSYGDIDKQVLSEYKIIINCTPLGTFPNTSAMPPIPVNHLSADHLVYDLIYNPSITKFMELSRKNGAVVVNGLRMLELQAEKAWEIWNSN